MNIVVSRLLGGLGNQMFQYAMGRAVSLAQCSPLVLDKRPLDQPAAHTPRKFALDVFDIRAAVPDHAAWQTWRNTEFQWIQESGPRFMPEALSARGAVCLNGYWQSERYIRAIRPVLQLDFRLKAAPTDEMQQWARRMRQPVSGRSSVMLHVRRGDYVSLPSAAAHHGVCTLAYYERSLQWLREQHGPLEVFVFSDDPAWAHTHLQGPDPMHIVSLPGAQARAAEQDLWLMQQCQHHVIANSSYSWWAAWLSQTDDSSIVAPRQWVQTPGFDTRDVVPSCWHTA